MNPDADISDVPHFKGELGFQYVNARGWFAQPSYGYMGPRWQAYNVSDPAQAS